MIIFQRVGVPVLRRFIAQCRYSVSEIHFNHTVNLILESVKDARQGVVDVILVFKRFGCNLFKGLFLSIFGEANLSANFRIVKVEICCAIG